MDVPELLSAMAVRLNGLEILESAHYPPPDQIQTRKKPVAVLYWAGEVDTIISPDMDGDLWEPGIKLQLLIPRKGHTPAEFATIDTVIPRIVRIFNRDGVVGNVLPGLTGHVDRLRVTRVRSTLNIEYAGHDHYGAELFFSAKFHDYEEELP
jgi:hypothetical protein